MNVIDENRQPHSVLAKPIETLRAKEDMALLSKIGIITSYE